MFYDFFCLLQGFLAKTPRGVGFFSPLFAEASRNKNPTPRKKLRNRVFLKKNHGGGVFIHLSDVRLAKIKTPPPGGFREKPL